ncbi:MAG: BON domain-containing protein [Cyanobacteria bacterium]|nr:BON domain-containing protein [Cyanobacteriota bacterium]
MSRQRLIGKVLVIGLLVTSAIVISGCGPTDTEISTQLQEKLTADETLAGSDIRVVTKNRVVTLTGTVENQAAKEHAATIARETTHPHHVIDQIKVTEETGTWPPGPGMAHEGMERGLSDSRIVAAVRDRLMTDSSVVGLHITVDARGGTVLLSGTVRSEVERRQAVEVARQTRGVTRVEHKLKVGR